MPHLFDRRSYLESVVTLLFSSIEVLAEDDGMTFFVHLSRFSLNFLWYASRLLAMFSADCRIERSRSQSPRERVVVLEDQI